MELEGVVMGTICVGDGARGRGYRYRLWEGVELLGVVTDTICGRE